MFKKTDRKKCCRLLGSGTQLKVTGPTTLQGTIEGSVALHLRASLKKTLKTVIVNYLEILDFNIQLQYWTSITNP